MLRIQHSPIFFLVCVFIVTRLQCYSLLEHRAKHHNKHHWYIVASLQKNLNALHWLQAWLAKSLTLCSPVCSLGCCRLSGSKLLGWNTGCIDRRDYRGLDRERGDMKILNRLKQHCVTTMIGERLIRQTVAAVCIH